MQEKEHKNGHMIHASDDSSKTLTYHGSGMRLDKRLVTQLPYSRSFFENLLKSRRITLTPNPSPNRSARRGEMIYPKKSYKLQEGDEIVIESLERFTDGGILEEAAYRELKVESGRLKVLGDVDYIPILLEKEDYMVIVKPKGVLSHPNSVWDLSTPSVVASVYQYIKSKAESGKSKIEHILPSTGNFIRAGLIHRLDRDTDGLMIVVKTEKGLAYFKDLFQQKSLASTIQEKEAVLLKKYYRAVCEVTPQGQAFLDEIDSYPYVIQEDVVPKVPHPTIKEGITKILRVGPHDTLTPSPSPKHSAIAPLGEGSYSFVSDDRVTIDVEILTGRTHQIRYHLSKHGLPIVGDYLYGTERENVPMQLTARRLEFRDVAGEMVSVEV